MASPSPAYNDAPKCSRVARDSRGLTRLSQGPAFAPRGGAVCARVCPRVFVPGPVPGAFAASFPCSHLEPALVCYRGGSMSRRAVVFGAAGQLGTELVRELRHRRFTVMAWDRSQVDITDPVAVQDALANSDAEVVFNAAAYNQVDVAEK